MSRERLDLPRIECLECPYPSTQKGGTLLVEDVRTLEKHLAYLRSPDGYRPEECARCQHARLHVHDRRERLGQDGVPLVLMRYRCMGCGARWQMVPAFMAPYLRQPWSVVERVSLDEAPAPARTARRWRARLRASALYLVQVLAASGAAGLAKVASRVGLEATRGELVAALAQPLWAVAALLHRLVPGVRLM